MFSIVLGLLEAVGSLQVRPNGGSARLIWTAPFTLPFPLDAPDITYCVDVTNTHENIPNVTPVLIHSECGIVPITYDFLPTFNISECDSFAFTVTPINLAGNGTSALITGQAFDELIINNGRLVCLDAKELRI